MNRYAWIAASMLLPVAAFAAGAPADGAHHAPHVANWWGLGEQYKETPALGWLTITFVIFATALILILKKPLNIHLENRSIAVKRAIEEARRAKDDAEARAKAAEAKLAALDSEVRKMKADFEAQGKSEAERLENVGRVTAARIQKDAEDTIAAEVDRAQQVLRAEAGRLALELAEERIKAVVTAEDDARLRTALVNHLSA